MDVPELDRAQLLAAARAYLEWEVEVSGFGLPKHVRRPVVVEAATAVSMMAETRASPSPTTPTPTTSPPTSPIATTPTTSLPTSTLSATATATNSPSAASASAASAPDRRLRLAQLDEQVRGCTQCELSQGRTHTVFARGNPDSPVVFVGEGPGQEEDRSGSPFVGPAGQLLDKMVVAMGFARDAVYICNVVKCRPPGNRTPLASEAAACSPFLLGQLDAIRPRVIVALGRCATENLGLAQDGGWRGRWGKFRGIDVMPTYHPAFLLRSPEYKRPVWEDLQKVMGRLKDPA